jgi:hypothetical protein
MEIWKFEDLKIDHLLTFVTIVTFVTNSPGQRLPAGR